MRREPSTDPVRVQLAEHLRRLAADGLWGFPHGAIGAAAPATIAGATSEGALEREKPPPRTRQGPAATGGLAAIEAEALGCEACRLCETRTHVVFGVGDPRARLMFIGEGPGHEEDLKGEPFVGAAGQVLDRIIVAMGLTRERVYIANTVKCRPPKNRNPEPDELAACRHFLIRQIEAIGPELIVLLGRVAAQAVLESDEPLGRLRGRFIDWRGIPVMCTYHPAYLLRNPADKRKTWEDIQQVMARLGVERS